MTLRELDKVQLDTLKEISSMGMSHAATALAQMIGQTAPLGRPQATITAISQVPHRLGGRGKRLVSITLQILGEARGCILLLFSEEDARRLLDRLLGRQTKRLVMNEQASSALMEVGNILASAFLSALGARLGTTLIPSLPLLESATAGALVDRQDIGLGRPEVLAVMMETACPEGPGRAATVKGHFIMIPDPATLDIYLKPPAGTTP